MAARVLHPPTLSTLDRAGPSDARIARTRQEDAIDVNKALLLHHGTTLRAANQIVQDGWRPLDVRALIERLASDHQVDGVAVREVLAQWYRFAIVAEGRGANASFAPDAAKVAHSWAQRAPESEWEVLWAIYHVLHPDAGEHGWSSDLAGEAWVWEQMRHEPLAVLSYVTSYPELATLGAREGPARHELGPPELVIPDWETEPEISFDLPFRPDPARLVVTPVPRHLPRGVYAHRLGLSFDEFDHRAEWGDFGEPASHGVALDRLPFVERPWWDSATAPLIPPADA